MNRKLATQDLATLFAERSGMDMKSSMAFVKAVFEIVQEYVAKDKLVKIKGFGTFKLVSVSDRESINVNTGERIVISGHTKLSFTPDSALRDAVNRPFADFETTPLNEGTPLEEMERVPSNNETQSAIGVQETDSDTTSTPVLQNENVEEDAEGVEPEVLPAETVSEDVLPEAIVQPGGIVSDVAGQELEQVQAGVQESESEPVPSYPMASGNMMERTENARHCRWFYPILTLVLMATSYFCGYYRVLERLDITLQRNSEPSVSSVTGNSIQSPEETAVHPMDTISVEPDSIPGDTVMQSSSPEENYEEMARQYPQVKDGEYWIVGDAGRVHYMQVGETLYRIAGKELGDQKLIRYLIVFNDFKDPNVLHKDQPIRIPKLVRKSPGSEQGMAE